MILRETLKKIIWNSLAPFRYASTSFQMLFFFFFSFNVSYVQNGEAVCCCRLGHNLSWYRNNRDQSVNDLYTTNKDLEGW